MEGKRFIIPIFISHLGCPHRCVYCDQSRIAQPAPGIPTSEAIATEIKHYLGLRTHKQKDYRTVQVAFYGGSFTALPLATQAGLLRTGEPFLKGGMVNSLRVSTRPDYCFPECLEILKAYGVATVELGVQSMADDVLRISLRGYGKEKVKEAVRDLRQQGFEIGVQLMVGLPGDSSDRFVATVEEVIQLRPDFVRLYPTIVIKGTQLERWFRQGHYSPLSLEQAITLTKEGLKRFHEAHVPVIRIGLQPTPSLPGNIVAGPYHPAFRQLVESVLLYEQAADLLAQFPREGNISPTFFVSPKDISTFYGQGRRNIRRLQEAFDLQEIRVRPDHNQERGTVSLGM